MKRIVKALESKCLCLVKPNPISENFSRFVKEEEETFHTSLTITGDEDIKLTA